MARIKLTKVQKSMLLFIKSSDGIRIKVNPDEKTAIVITNHKSIDGSIYISKNNKKVLRWSTFYRLLFLGYIEATGDIIDGIYPVFSSKSKECDGLVIAKNDIQRISVIMRIEGKGSCFRIRSVVKFLVNEKEAYAYSATHAFQYLKKMKYIQEVKTEFGKRWFML